MDLSRKIIILIYGRAFSFLISLAIPITLTRLLLKEDYGTYQQLVMIYSVIQAILLLGIPQSLLYYYPRNESEAHPLLVKQTWSIVGFSSLFVILASLGISEGMEILESEHHLQPFIFLIGIYTGIMLLVMPLQNLLVLEGKESLAMQCMIGFTVIDIIVLPSAAWLNPSTLGMVYGIIATAITKAAIVLVYIYLNYLNKAYVGNTFYKEQLAYGIPVGLTAMIYVINVNIDKYLVAMFFSTSVFGVYYLGSLWAPIFGWFTQSASQVITPRLSKAHKDNNLVEMRNLYNKSIEKLSFLFFPLTIFLILMAEPLIITMFTGKYEDAIPIFTIYMTLLPTYSFRIGWILMASGQTKFLLRLAIIVSVINIAFSYFLITNLEGDDRLLGIPFATVMVTWFSTFAIMYQSMHTLDVKIVDAYPWRKIFSILFISLISAAPLFMILSLDISEIYLLIISSLVYGVIFLYLTFRMEIWGETEIRLLNSFFSLKNS